MAETIALVGGTSVTPLVEIPDALVLIEGDRIAWVGPRAENEPPPGARIEDVGGKTIFPGFIDTHVHGTHGDDVMVHGADGIRRISANFARSGCTSWLPSTIADTHERLLRAIDGCVDAAEHPADGADVVGLHIEGPYINLKRKGAQPAHGIRDPNFDEVEELLAASRGWMRIMTLAPELPGGLELIRLLTSRGVIASLGHSDSDYDTALAAIEAGATHCTHLFNAMPPLHHREPGLIAACLNEPDIIAEVIPDGVHLHPQTVRLALNAKGPDGAALITDGFTATGLGDGTHSLAGMTVHVEGTLCTLDGGTIAGSILTMNYAVRNAMQFASISRTDAARMACLVPARLSGCADRKGSLEPGKDADIAVLNDDYSVHLTLVRGREVYRNGQ